MSSRNVREKLWLAIRALTTSGGTLQERLVSAATGLCSLPSNNELPKQYEEALSSIIRNLTKNHAVGNEGRIEATTRKISDQDASRIANEILDLYTSLRGGI
ncbi:hypothetical protein HDF09_000528 [Edaphobacter lichenicola]|uniref:Uncharacterized protein n=1 Tax=Tunturiibacter empetritectus TaxID=3069691 RepID=A0A7W8IGN0_9BACT|nr:hypothetical protein [Edaphobacter lichenicola]